MNGTGLCSVLEVALERLAESSDELRDLDAALGDGDLGITIRKGAEAVRARMSRLEDPTPPEVLRAAGSAFASGNPSTMAALVSGGLLAAAKALGDVTEIARADAVLIGRKAAESIAIRGRAKPGDKTVLDAIDASLEALTAAPADQRGRAALSAMAEAADQAVRVMTDAQSRRGRASWLGERSIGHPDPGATAYLRFLEALAAAWPP